MGVRYRQRKLATLLRIALVLGGISLACGSTDGSGTLPAATGGAGVGGEPQTPEGGGPNSPTVTSDCECSSGACESYSELVELWCASLEDGRVDRMEYEGCAYRGLVHVEGHSLVEAFFDESGAFVGRRGVNAFSGSRSECGKLCEEGAVTRCLVCGDGQALTCD